MCKDFRMFPPGIEKRILWRDLVFFLSLSRETTCVSSKNIALNCAYNIARSGTYVDYLLAKNCFSFFISLWKLANSKYVS